MQAQGERGDDGSPGPGLGRARRVSCPKAIQVIDPPGLPRRLCPLPGRNVNPRSLGCSLHTHQTHTYHAHKSHTHSTTHTNTQTHMDRKPLLDILHNSGNRADKSPCPVGVCSRWRSTGNPRRQSRDGHRTLRGTPCRPPLDGDPSALIVRRMTGPRTKKSPCLQGGGHLGLWRGWGCWAEPWLRRVCHGCWRAAVWGPLLQDRSETAEAVGPGPRERRGGWGPRLL